MPSQAVEEPSFSRIEFATAAEVCADLELEEEAGELLDDEPGPRQFFERLVEAGLLVDAVRFLARALPKREAAWWACLAVREAWGGEPPPAELPPLEAAEAWVRDPAEEARRAALEAAEATAYETPAGWAAAAAGWSGGSLAPPDLQEVAPAERLTGLAAASAVLLAAAAGEPQEVEPRQRKFLEAGVRVATGESRWAGETAEAPPAGRSAASGRKAR